jgi:RNA polymerase sigma-70 factor (ECF subfamily)
LRTVRRRREQPLYREREGGEVEDEDVPAWIADDAALGPGAAVERSERLAEMRRLVDELPQGKRELVRLVDELEMTVRDAALQLGIPEGTAKSRLHYARRRLARQWQDLESTWEES